MGMGNEPLTKTDLEEFARGPLREAVTDGFERFSAGPLRTVVREEIAEFSNGSMRTAIREEIGEFTKEVLLPAVERIVDDKIGSALGAHRDQMIDYIDRRIGAAVGELTATIRGDRERYREVFVNLLDVLKRNNLINDEEQLRVVKLIP